MTCYIYILASRSRAIYIGVTNDLQRRLYEHRHQASKRTHTARYRITRLVYFEVADIAYAAIAREKQLKGWMRTRKVALIEEANPTWDDMASQWFSSPESRSFAPLRTTSWGRTMRSH